MVLKVSSLPLPTRETCNEDVDLIEILKKKCIFLFSFEKREENNRRKLVELILEYLCSIDQSYFLSRMLKRG